jgi:hypothetical protein
MAVPKPRNGENIVACYDRVYHSNRDIIGTMCHWRRLFRITDRGLDRSVAYVLEKIRKKHVFAWKAEINKLMNEILKNPIMFPSIIGYYMMHNYNHDLQRILKTTGLDTETDEKLRYNIEENNKQIALYQKALKEGQIKAAYGVPDDYLPEWYFVAGDGFPTYAQDFIKPYVADISNKENSLEKEEEKMIQQLRYMKFLMTPQLYNSKVNGIINELQVMGNQKLSLISLNGTSIVELGDRMDKFNKTIDRQSETLLRLSRLINENKNHVPHKDNMGDMIRVINNIQTNLAKQKKAF